MSEETPLLESDRYKIIDGLVIDCSKHKITSPFIKCLENQVHKIPEVVALYLKWSSYPTGTVIKYKCPQAALSDSCKVLKTFKKPNEDEIKKHDLDEKLYEDPDIFYAISSRKKGFKETCYRVTIRNSTTLYLWDNVPVANRLSPPDHQPSDDGHHEYESATALTTVLRIDGFASWFSKQTIDTSKKPDFDLDIRGIISTAFIQFKLNQQFLDLDVAPTSSMNTETMMANHEISTMDSYLPYLKRIYFFMCNLHLCEGDVDQSILDDISKLNDDINNVYTDEKPDFAKMKSRIFFLRSIMIKLLSNDAMFTFPVKVALLDDNAILRKRDYCIKVLNAYKFFYKYILIFTEEKKVPQEFLDVFYEKNTKTMNKLYSIYSSVFGKHVNLTNFTTIKQPDGTYLINGTSFSPKNVQKRFKMLKELYDSKIDALKKYGVCIYKVNYCYRKLSNKYTFKPNSSFYSCFPQKVMHSLISGVNTSMVNEDNRHIFLKILNDFTTIIILLVFISSGASLRLTEFPKLLASSDEQALFLCKGPCGVEYCYFSTIANKNRSHNKRFIFMNHQVSKYMIHYVSIIKPFWHTIGKKMNVDKRLLSLTPFMESHNIPESSIQQFVPAGELVTVSTDAFVRKYLFISSIVFNGEDSITKAISSRCYEMLSCLFGPGYGANSWRQAFVALNEDVSMSEGLAVSAKYSDVVNQNAGHSSITAVQNYAYNAKALQDDRAAAFKISLEILIKLNNMLGLEKEVVEVEKIQKYKWSKLLFGFCELEKAKKDLFENLQYRNRQEPVIHAAAAAPHGYALQAPTGFGKTVLFSVLLKAVNNYDRNLVNVVIVPYTPLKVNMQQRLQDMGFNVGGMGSLLSGWQSGFFCDVYVCIYDEIKISGLDVPRTNLGMVVFDEAHCLEMDASYRDCLNDFKDYNFHLFQKILLLSATFTNSMAVSTQGFLNFQTPLIYSDLITRHPNEGKVFIYNINYRLKDESCYEVLDACLCRFISNYDEGKAIVFFNNKCVLSDVSRKFKDCLEINGDMTTDEKSEVINQFVGEPENRVLMGTKLISNGIDVSAVKLVVFYDYIPENVEFIQGLGRIRSTGVCLVLHSIPFCGSRAVSKFYGFQDDEHHWCCELPNDEEVLELFECVVGGKSRAVVEDSYIDSFEATLVDNDQPAILDDEFSDDDAVINLLDTKTSCKRSGDFSSNAVKKMKKVVDKEPVFCEEWVGGATKSAREVLNSSSHYIYDRSVSRFKPNGSGPWKVFRIYHSYRNEDVPELFKNFSRRIQYDPLYIACFAEIYEYFGGDASSLCHYCLCSSCSGCDDRGLLAYQSIVVLHVTGVMTCEEIYGWRRGLNADHGFDFKALEMLSLFEEISTRLCHNFRKSNSIHAKKAFHWESSCGVIQEVMVKYLETFISDSFSSLDKESSFKRSGFFNGVLKLAQIGSCIQCHGPDHNYRDCKFKRDMGKSVCFVNWVNKKFDLPLPRLFQGLLKDPLYSLYYNLCLYEDNHQLVSYSLPGLKEEEVFP